MDPLPPAPKLLADAMLGALARWLRILDVDVAYDPELDDAALVNRAVAEDRVILTRDRRLTHRRLARDRHLLIRSEVVDEQVRQVLEESGISPDPQRFLGRCLQCNLPLDPMEASQARARIPPWVARTHDEYRACPAAAGSTGGGRTRRGSGGGWRGCWAPERETRQGHQGRQRHQGPTPPVLAVFGVLDVL